MGRPKGSTDRSDTKIILALLYRPRRFSEFEWALVEEFGRDLPKEVKVKHPIVWKGFVRTWGIPRKTLARRLKALVAKGWIIRTVLPIHGHHVEYRLNFSKREEMLKESPSPELHLTRSQVKLIKKAEAVTPLKEELPGLDRFSRDEVLDIFLRLRSGEFVCPKCLEKGEGERALNVSKDADGRFYCRNCGEEVLPEECEELREEIFRKNFSKISHEFMKDISRFFAAIDRQIEE